MVQSYSIHPLVEHVSTATGAVMLKWCKACCSSARSCCNSRSNAVHISIVMEEQVSHVHRLGEDGYVGSWRGKKEGGTGQIWGNGEQMDPGAGLMCMLNSDPLPGLICLPGLTMSWHRSKLTHCVCWGLPWGKISLYYKDITWNLKSSMRCRAFHLSSVALLYEDLVRIWLWNGCQESSYGLQAV